MGSLNKNQIIIIIVIGILFILVIGMYMYTTYSQKTIDLEDSFYEEENSEKSEKKTMENEKELEEIMVHIAGEVNEQGVVQVKMGSRIIDVVEEAGGFTQNANVEKVNLAYIVEDGQKITIPNNENIEDNDFSYVSKESGDNIVEKSVNEKGENDMVNINEATQTQLEELPGIGPSTALKIMEYRKENGDFKQIEDIKNVNGIGEAKFDKIKDYISVK